MGLTIKKNRTSLLSKSCASFGIRDTVLTISSSHGFNTVAAIAPNLCSWLLSSNITKLCQISYTKVSLYNEAIIQGSTVDFQVALKTSQI